MKPKFLGRTASIPRKVRGSCGLRRWACSINASDSRGSSPGHASDMAEQRQRLRVISVVAHRRFRQRERLVNIRGTNERDL